MHQNTFATIIIGDSHYAALASAAQESLSFNPETRGCDLIFFDAWKHELRYPFTVGDGSHAVLNPQMAQFIQMFEHNYDGIELVTVFGGGHHLALIMLDNNHPMDIILPHQPNLPLRSDALLVTINFAKEILLKLIQTPFSAMECLRTAFPHLAISQIECPPANGDNIFVRTRLGNYFEKNFDSAQYDAISTPTQRYKFWKLQSEMYAEKCNELGINYIRVPEAAISSDGFLRPEHYGLDSTHANSAYGRIILDRIESHLGRKFVAWNSFG